jgi:hypothetical protein
LGALFPLFASVQLQMGLGSKGNRKIHACRANLSRQNPIETEAGEGGKHTKMIEPQKNTENAKI